MSFAVAISREIRLLGTTTARPWTQSRNKRTCYQVH